MWIKNKIKKIKNVKNKKEKRKKKRTDSILEIVEEKNWKRIEMRKEEKNFQTLKMKNEMVTNFFSPNIINGISIRIVMCKLNKVYKISM